MDPRGDAESCEGVQQGTSFLIAPPPLFQEDRPPEGFDSRIRFTDSTSRFSLVRLSLACGYATAVSMCSGELETGKLYSKTQNSCSTIGPPWTSKIGQFYVSSDITRKIFGAKYSSPLFCLPPGSGRTSQMHTNNTTRTPRPTFPPESAPASQTGNPSSRKPVARNGARSRWKRITRYERGTRSMERSGPKSSRTPFSKTRNAGQRI